MRQEARKRKTDDNQLPSNRLAKPCKGALEYQKTMKIAVTSAALRVLNETVSLNAAADEMTKAVYNQGVTIHRDTCRKQIRVSIGPEQGPRCLAARAWWTAYRFFHLPSPAEASRAETSASPPAAAPKLGLIPERVQEALDFLSKTKVLQGTEVELFTEKVVARNLQLVEASQLLTEWVKASSAQPRPDSNRITARNMHGLKGMQCHRFGRQEDGQGQV